MSLCRVEDIAHVRFACPDLDRMRGFLDAFGLVTWMGTDGALYGRGAGAAPFLHATTAGPPGFLGLGLRAANPADLEVLARHEGAAVTPLDAPGGGRVVRLTDPDGHAIEVVADQTPAPTLSIPAEPARNSATVVRRTRAALRLDRGPAHVKRLGHAVLGVSDFRRSEAWYRERFGFLTSDEIEAAPGMAIGAFMRCDRGDTPSDHHTLFLLQAPEGPGFLHAAFEVAHLDDLMAGHDHLKAQGAQAFWGVGRHILGGQVFDYWKDPWGHELEHWTDGDLFTAADPPGKATLADLLGVQWGEPHPMLARR